MFVILPFACHLSFHQTLYSYFFSFPHSFYLSSDLLRLPLLRGPDRPSRSCLVPPAAGSPLQTHSAPHMECGRVRARNGDCCDACWRVLVRTVIFVYVCTHGHRDFSFLFSTATGTSTTGGRTAREAHALTPSSLLDPWDR
jgi:hypothetical protein